MNQEIIYDIETQETTIRQFTEIEIAESEKIAADFEMKKIEEQNKIAEKIALYQKMGLTVDEAKVLLS